MLRLLPPDGKMHRQRLHRRESVLPNTIRDDGSGRGGEQEVPAGRLRFSVWQAEKEGECVPWALREMMSSTFIVNGREGRWLFVCLLSSFDIGWASPVSGRDVFNAYAGSYGLLCKRGIIIY